MSRELLRTRAMSRIETFRLDDGVEVFIKPLSALDRAKFLDLCRALGKIENNEHFLAENVRCQAFAISRSLVDKSGSLLYGEDDIAAIDSDIDRESQEALTIRVIALAGLNKRVEAEKNLQPTPSADSSSD